MGSGIGHRPGVCGLEATVPKMARLAVCLLIVASALIGGCGSGASGDSSTSEEANTRAGSSEGAKARAAVAVSITALYDDGAAAACEALTEAAQRQTAKEANRIKVGVEQPGNVAPGDCVGGATVILEAVRASGSEQQIRKYAEGIESGEVQGEPVRVALTGDRGTVTVTGRDVAIEYRVERVDGEWLVAGNRLVNSGDDR